MSLRWVPQRPEYYIRTGNMLENPYGVPRDEVLRYIVTNTPENVAQVVFGKYVESSGLVFSGELIQNAIDYDVKVRGDVYLDRQRLEEFKSQDWYYGDRTVWPFHTGIDFGRQTDYTVITTLDTEPVTRGLPAKVVYYKRLNRVPWEAIYGEVGRAVSLFGPNVLCDASGPAGDVIMDALQSRRYCAAHHRTHSMVERCRDQAGEPADCDPEDYLYLNCADGYYFSVGQGQAKKELVEHLRNCLSTGYRGVASGTEFGLLRFPFIPQLEEELTFYMWDDKRLQTDCVFSLALSAWSGLEDVVGPALVGSVFGQ